ASGRACRSLAIGRAHRQEGARLMKFAQGPSAITLDGVGPGKQPVDLGGLAMGLADQPLASFEAHSELLQGRIDAAGFQQELRVANISGEELVQRLWVAAETGADRLVFAARPLVTALEL